MSRSVRIGNGPGGSQLAHPGQATHYAIEAMSLTLTSPPWRRYHRCPTRCRPQSASKKFRHVGLGSTSGFDSTFAQQNVGYSCTHQLHRHCSRHMPATRVSGHQQPSYCSIDCAPRDPEAFLFKKSNFLLVQSSLETKGAARKHLVAVAGGHVQQQVQQPVVAQHVHVVTRPGAAAA